MLLKSIKLENFRQFVDEKIDFSVNKDKNVTLIVGGNGTGKTTFAQAFIWCLYGETTFSDKILLNRMVAEKLTPDESATVKVTLQLDHGSASYEITRKQIYKKSYNNKIKDSHTILTINVKFADGNTRYFKPLECESEIKNILPRELANYFFFDGERIEKMSKEIASGRRSSSFANAVLGLTGLKATLEAINHMSPTRSTSVIGRLDAEYAADSEGKIQRLTKEINDLQDKLNKNNNRLREIDNQIEIAVTSKKKFEDDIKQYAEGEKLQKEREKILRLLDSAEKTKANYIKGLFKIFNTNTSVFFSLSLVVRALKLLSESNFKGKDIPEMHTKTIEFLLERKMCICGTHLDEGTVPYDKVKELIDYLPPQSIGVIASQFIKDSRNKFLSDINLKNDVKEKIALIEEHDDNIKALNGDLTNIDTKLQGADISRKVKLINDSIHECAKKIAELQKEKSFRQVLLGKYINEKNNKENSRGQLALLDKKNQRIERLKAIAKRIYEDLKKNYKQREKEIRNELQNSINEIFKSIYEGGMSLTIDEKYNISVYVEDFEGGVETSTAQSISVIFAFISAIIKMARENRENKGDEAYSEPYPLVMDAPLSSFDKRRIKTICDTIPDIAEQVIIFIKDTDGELAENYLGSKVTVRHYFEKIDEFNTKLR